MIIPELPDYLTSLGGEDYKGLIISLFALTAGLSRPFSGKLADNWGRIPVMIYGSAVCILAGILYPVFTTAAGFFIVRIIHGMSTGFKPTGTSSYIGDISPVRRRGEAMGVLGVFASTGMAMGPVLGSQVRSIYGIEWMFYVSSLLAALSVVVLVGMKESLNDPKPFRLNMLKIKKGEVLEPRVFASGIVMFFLVYSFGSILTVIPDFSDHLGIRNKGIFFLYITISSLLIRFIAGRASDRYGRIRVLKVGLAIIIIAMFFIGDADTSFQLLTAGVIFGVGSGISSPTIYAWNVDLSDPKHLGRAMSTMYIALEAGIICGSFFSGLIFDNDPQNFPLTFRVGGGTALVALLFLQWFGRHRRSTPFHGSAS